MPDLEDLFEWIEDTFEDVFEDAFEAVEDSVGAKMLLGGCVFAVLAIIAVALGVVGVLAFPVIGIALAAVALIASPLIYYYFIQDKSARSSDERSESAGPAEASRASDAHALTDRQVRAQAKRIGGKCKRLRREAKKTGGVYGGLTWHADEMRQRARELCDTVIRLRNGLRQIARSHNPTLPPGVRADAGDERLQSEFDAARNAQARLDDVVERNRQREHLCLAQLERIEDLVDAARLELTHPVSEQTLNGTASSVAEDLETELELSRQALAEVEQQSELEA